MGSRATRVKGRVPRSGARPSVVETLEAQSPFLRAANIGFRCVKYIDANAIPKEAFSAMPTPRRDLTKEKPVSDQVFQAYRGLYSYDKTPLNASVEAVESKDQDWRTQKITYSAAYGHEQAISYLFLPNKGKQPYQVVLFFPGSGALNLRHFVVYPTASLDAVLRSGRAVMYPIYKSTYERGDGMEDDVPNMSSDWRDHVIMWAKDASRAIDYIDTRSDLDHSKIAYYGYSWGAVMGAIVPAVDQRIKVNIIALGGIEFQRSLPEVDPINFLPHVKQPALMLNGHYAGISVLAPNSPTLYPPLGTPAHKYFLWPGLGLGTRSPLCQCESRNC